MLDDVNKGVREAGREAAGKLRPDDLIQQSSEFLKMLEDIREDAALCRLPPGELSTLGKLSPCVLEKWSLDLVSVLFQDMDGARELQWTCFVQTIWICMLLCFPNLKEA